MLLFWSQQARGIIFHLVIHSKQVPWENTVESGAQWANATEVMVLVASASSLGGSTAGDPGVKSQVMSKGSASKKSQGAFECQGDWELKARRSGRQDLGLRWVSQLPLHRTSLQKECSPREWFPSLLKEHRVPSEKASLCKDPTGAASEAATHRAGTMTTRKVQSAAIQSQWLSQPHFVFPHKAAVFDIGWVAALKSVERDFCFSHSTDLPGSTYQNRS